MVNFALTVFGVDWVFLKPYIVLGLALGGVYALSGVGVVVLYQATGVLNLAFGAIGAAGALIAYYFVNHTSLPHWFAYLACVVFGAVVNVALRDGARPGLRRARPAREDDGDARAGADPARGHGLAGARGRRVRARAPAADLQRPLRGLRRDRHADADHRARLRVRAHDRHDGVPALHEDRHGDARARERSRDHRHARRARAPGRAGGLAAARASCAAPPGSCSPTCSRRSTTPRSPSS